MKKKSAYLWILIASVLWGTTGTAQAFAPESAHPIAIGATRLAIGGSSLLLIVIILGQLNLKNWPIKTTVLAALSMAIYQPFFFSSVKVTGIAIGTVVAIGSAPILSGIIEWIFLNKKPPQVWWYSTGMAILGCLFLFINKESMNINLYGIFMALGAGLSFACYAIVSRKLVEEQASLPVVAIVFTLSAIFLSPFLFILDMSWMTEIEGIAVSLHLGVIVTGLAYFLFSQGLKSVSSSTAVTLSLAEPLTATLLGVLLVGERLAINSWIGILLLLLGLGLLIFSPQK